MNVRSIGFVAALLGALGVGGFFGWVTGRSTAPGGESVGVTEHGWRTGEGPLYGVKIGDRYGFIDASGAVRIEPKYERAAPSFCDGFAAVRHSNRWGFINVEGELKIPGPFARVDQFSEGLAAVSGADGKWGYIDTGGDYVISPRFDTTERFIGGVAEVGEERFWSLSKWGLADVGIDARKFFVDSDGQVVEDDAALQRIAGAIEWPRPVSVSGRVVYVSRIGERAFDKVFKAGLPFKGALAPACDLESGEWGYIDRSGDYVIQPQFVSAKQFAGELAEVMIVDPAKKNSLMWARVNRNGAVVFPERAASSDS